MIKELEKEFEALDQLMDLVTCQGCFEKAQKCYYIIEEAFDELLEYKQLEELVGCPLKVREQALLKGIYYESKGFGNTNLGKTIICFSKTPKLKLDYETHSYLCFEVSGSHNKEKKCLPLSEYKISWWLKKDRSE